MDIDEQLAACGWEVHDYKHAAVAAARGVAVREVPTDAGPADYVLFVDRQAVGVIEAQGVAGVAGRREAGNPRRSHRRTVQTAIAEGMPRLESRRQ